MTMICDHENLPTELSSRKNSGFVGLKIVVVLPLLLLACGGCGDSAPDDSGEPKSQREQTSISSAPRPPARQSGYVGSSACAECHAEIAESYQTHPMARSLVGIREESKKAPDVATSFETSPDCIYRVASTDGGAVVHSETRQDADGNLLYEQSVPIDHVVGSGKRGHSYLTNRKGLLFMSPVAWYTQGNKYDLSPGYRPESHPRFSRRVSDSCLVCHSGLTDPVNAGPHRYRATPFLEESIGCERCHGPGRDHIEFQSLSENDSTTTESATDPMLALGQLGPRLRDDICNQCHILGIERVLRYGRTEFDFRPGDRLIDIWATFVSGEDRVSASGKATRAVSQVEQMHSSACYRKSSGLLTCTSCHDPHRSPAPEEKPEFYRSRCLACHQDEGTSCSAPAEHRRLKSDSCIECHMPALEASDVPHTSQTDHRILRNAAARTNNQNRDRIVATPEPRLFQEAESALSPQALKRVRGLLLAHLADSSQNPRMGQEALVILSGLTKFFPDDPELLDALGSVRYLMGDYRRARDDWTKALLLQPERESVVEGLMLVARRHNQHAKALEYVNRLIDLNPWREQIFLHKSQILNALGDRPESIAAAEKGLELNPGSEDILRWLIEICQKSGQTEKSATWRHRLDRLRRASPVQRP